ncbi:winged helix-turn-helix transcriptional regulator [Streptomyces roseirectus]|uniref:Winged helix-turn-helix transcriptional regulator n=1 Tax=Streptomyces roseirectus TaxID=2768066 RepID=A0A7H0IKY7_9ACTN|nr:MarR family winged helix-turn-helix transcriptional regulator [Streptomyces roseirectus]QNP73453.1 winged helix-turn-helix transcriptional regulator [Streptomyces roseirectus]
MEDGEHGDAGQAPSDTSRGPLDAGRTHPATSRAHPGTGRSRKCGPVNHALIRTARQHRHVSARLLRGLGLHPGQELVMMHLWGCGAARQSDLVKLLDLDPSTVTKMLQRLEQAGHVRRLPDPADGRAVLVEATDTSSHLLDEVERAWTELEERSLAGFGEEERAVFLSLLRRVEDNLCTGDRPESC